MKMKELLAYTEAPNVTPRDLLQLCKALAIWIGTINDKIDILSKRIDLLDQQMDLYEKGK